MPKEHQICEYNSPVFWRTLFRSEWDSRRLRFLNKRYKLKDTAVKTVQQPQHEIADSGPASYTPVALETPSADQVWLS